MKRRRWALIGCILALALVCVVVLGMAGCTKQPQSDKEQQVDAVAETGPQLEPLPPTAPPKPRRPPVASQGDCAPRYPAGGRGTCINNQPCRGHGESNPDGKAVCTCFGLDGGCAEGQRCDNERGRCVSEKEPPFGRAVPE